MRVLTDEEAHVLMLDGVDLIYEEYLIAERLVQRGCLTAQFYVEDNREYTDFLITHLGEIALQCYIALKTQKSFQP